MSTGIYRESPIGEQEEVEQEYIDYWCKLCQFPYEEEEIGGSWVKVKCRSKELIQQCWDDSEAIAHKWHIRHECPFVHKGESCRCNDFKNIEEAFKVAGLEYKK